MTEPIITEDDFDEECTDGTIELKILVDKKQKAEILKYQDKAEKWDTFGSLASATRNDKIVERLKKYIEQDAILVTGMNDKDLKEELQKILGEEK